MTIIYYKANGKIKDVFGGELQTIANTYGELADSFALICDELEIDDDIVVSRTPWSFKVNIETKQLEILPVVNKYPIAK